MFNPPVQRIVNVQTLSSVGQPKLRVPDAIHSQFGAGDQDSQSSGAQHAQDDLSREVYGILGLPIDAVDIPTVVRNIESASSEKARYLISTPNLNFLITGWGNWEFKRSLLLSDLCPVDGVPIVWIARLLGVPIKRRVAGSDIFDALKAVKKDARGPLKVFLFGGPDGVAQAASLALNTSSEGLSCVGTCYPGYCSLEEMSTAEIIEAINASGADFLVASLGAQKGQAWLLLNHSKLTIPVRSHLGAAINFQGGTLKRAPLFFRRSGLEWLWRIKEEPHLWRRYWHDGTMLAKLMLARVLPLSVLAWRSRGSNDSFDVQACASEAGSTLKISGLAAAQNVERAIALARMVLTENKNVTIDLSSVKFIDARFFGLFLMLWKQLEQRGLNLKFTPVPASAKRLFRLNGFEFLLAGPIQPRPR
jgi:N-acetylglucosaminyldiphosphoundecaprenol N-acetyl-beta-D-mannosaminyltransferase